MSFALRMLLLTFIESFATICLERGGYFYARDVLGFSGVQNLWLALVFGAVYAAGATASHGLARRGGEKRLLVIAVAAQIVVQGAMVLWPLAAGLLGSSADPLAVWDRLRQGPPAAVLFAGMGAMGLLNGLKWPLIESYVSAGLAPAAQARAVGRFNVSWRPAVPLSLGTVGPLLAWQNWTVMALASAMNFVSLWMLRPVPARPVHLHDDHPDRPPPGQLARLRDLMIAHRWLMLCSYATMWILAALMPGIFESMKVPVGAATGLSGVLDVFRLLSFVALGLWAGWHGRPWVLAVSMALLPAGFFMVCFGTNMPTVLLGEAAFGLGAGGTSYGALYYAMVVKNASVEAGGGHEGLIGVGFALGPAAQLIGLTLAPHLGGNLPGTLASVGPVLLVCLIGAAIPILRRRN